MYSFDKILPNGRIESICIPRMPHLRANITYRCDRGCPNCNRACGIAKSNTQEDMTVEQFRIALDGVASAGTKLTKIILTGGEPSLHPNLIDFADLAMEYRKKISPECRVCISSYRHPKFFYRVEETVKKHKEITVLGFIKVKPRVHLYAPYMAPIDQPNNDPNRFYRGCHSNASLCGMTVDYQGFWCCPVAPAIARVFGLDVAIKSYDKVSLDSLVAQYGQVCCKCGYADNTRVKGNPEPMSKSWKEAVQAYIARTRI